MRIGIQVISYNRPEYLKSTLESIYSHMDKELDRVCVVEQSDEPGKQEECLKICSEFQDILVIPVHKNLGQRGATNLVFGSRFWDKFNYVMLSDHDNKFNYDLSIYCEQLDKDPQVWISSGYMSPEHDIENKKGSWIYKSTGRAGHMVLRKDDFYKMMPCDEKAGSSAWYCGLIN